MTRPRLMWVSARGGTARGSDHSKATVSVFKAVHSMSSTVAFGAAFALRDERLVERMGTLPYDSIVLPVVSWSIVSTAWTQGRPRLWRILVPSRSWRTFLRLSHLGWVDWVGHYPNPETHVLVMGGVRFLLRSITVSKPYEGRQILTANRNDLRLRTSSSSFCFPVRLPSWLASCCAPFPGGQ